MSYLSFRDKQWIDEIANAPSGDRVDVYSAVYEWAIAGPTEQHLNAIDTYAKQMLNREQYINFNSALVEGYEDYLESRDSGQS